MADISNDEERQSLLHADGSLSEISQHQSKRDKSAAEAVINLHQIVVVMALCYLGVSCVITVNTFVSNTFPSWVIFLLIWLGHAAIFFICFYSIRLMLQSMIAKNNRERFTQRWHQANEKRIPLLQFAIYHISWIFFLSIALIVFEILSYLAIIGVSQQYAIFVIPYVIIGISLSNSLVCR